VSFGFSFEIRLQGQLISLGQKNRRCEKYHFPAVPLSQKALPYFRYV
jgi:hypothetical protein